MRRFDSLACFPVLASLMLALAAPVSAVELDLSVSASSDLDAVLDVATATREPLTLSGTVRVDIEFGQDFVNGRFVNKLRVLASSLGAGDVGWTLLDALSDVTADLEGASVTLSSGVLMTPAAGLGTSLVAAGLVDIAIDDGLFTADGEALEVDVEVTRPFDVGPAALLHGDSQIVVGQGAGSIPVTFKLPFDERVPISSSSCVPWMRIEGSLLLRGRLPDTDGDGLPDFQDNCSEVANADQADVNADEDDDSSIPGVQHYGDACDRDLDDDGIVGASDFFAVFRPCLGVLSLRTCQAADFDGDGLVAPADFFGFLRPAFGTAPGPGIHIPPPKIGF